MGWVLPCSNHVPWDVSLGVGGLNLILFIFGCVGSSLPCRLPLVAASRGCSLVTGLGFSLRWLLLLKSMGSRARGLNSLVAPWHVGSSRIGIELMSPALADGLPLSYQGSPKPQFSHLQNGVGSSLAGLLRRSNAECG